jgi:hypothetical protein
LLGDREREEREPCRDKVIALTAKRGQQGSFPRPSPCLSILDPSTLSYNYNKWGRAFLLLPSLRETEERERLEEEEFFSDSKGGVSGWGLRQRWRGEVRRVLFI